jgi:membrane fusion protein, multidrug efflux system
MLRRGLAFFGLCMGLMAIGCSKSQGPGGPGARPDPPQVGVDAVAVVSIPLKEVREFTGRIAAAEQVEVRARVSGMLLTSPGYSRVRSVEIAGAENKAFQVIVREGDLVEVDTPLFEIDPAPYETILQQARGNLAAKQAQLSRLEADVLRASQLRKTNAISEAEYDVAVSNRDENVAQTATLKAQVHQAELNLKFTKVVAPIRGVLGRTLLTPGNLVSADSTLLSTIVSNDPIHVYFEVDENSLLEYRQKVRTGELDDPSQVETQILMGLGNEEGFPHAGKIDFIEPTNDSRTGTTVLRGSFTNKAGILKPGLFARVQVAFTKERLTLVVPTVALAMDQQGRYVYVVNSEMKVERRSVKIGSIQGELTTIVEGLSRDEQVITSGLQRVRPGSKIFIDNKKATDKTTSPAADTKKNAGARS